MAITRLYEVELPPKPKDYPYAKSDRLFVNMIAPGALHSELLFDAEAATEHMRDSYAHLEQAVHELPVQVRRLASNYRESVMIAEVESVPYVGVRVVTKFVGVLPVNSTPAIATYVGIMVLNGSPDWAHKSPLAMLEYLRWLRWTLPDGGISL